MVLIASGLLSCVLRVLKKNKKKLANTYLCVHTHVPLVIHKPCGRSLRISRAPFPPPPVALLIRMGDEDATRTQKIWGETIYFHRPVFPPRNAIFIRDPGHLRVSRCDTWTLSHESLQDGSRDFTARPRREWETVADSARRFILIALSLNTTLKRKEE